MKNIYVGNIPYTMREDQLSALFAQYGDVKSAKVVMDKHSGRSKGFGFVEMDDDPATEAISSLDGHEVEGRAIRVSEARPKPEGGSFDGGGGGGSRGGRYGGGERSNRGGGRDRDRGNRDFGNR